ncbi:antirepressor AbbA [Thermolongibacillus altinsuensis]|jgi:hypothetical protein|uniref:Antirepressor AbbA n=1 Tax=Thermolongibacillus altinsuensis TaxID=575256 RepID=A0A4R1QFF3_9BACL|nr:antirepressor AbbA [Thermolongibacillus altinsuensis]TCL49186.1 antirepressor AbbA [Thermolongibacillus altinsuensis]GMB08633.1 hypothetical protein B1no1_13430 [Thermolongibacillus altinsuensis]
MERRMDQQLSMEEQQLLVDLLFTQQYAIELISAELADIECGYKQVDAQRYKQLIGLYDRVRAFG